MNSTDKAPPDLMIPGPFRYFVDVYGMPAAGLLGCLLLYCWDDDGSAAAR